MKMIIAIASLLLCWPAYGQDNQWIPLHTLNIGNTARLYDSVFSPDGKQIVTIDLNTSKNSVRIWDTETGTLLNTIGKSETSVVFSPNGKRMTFSSILENGINLWDVEKGTLLRTFPGIDSIYPASFSPDSSKIVIVDWEGSENGSIKIWDVEKGTLLRTLSNKREWIAIFSPDGKKILTVDRDKLVDAELKIFDVEKGTLLLRIKQRVQKAVFSPNGKMILTRNDFAPDLGSEIKIWNAETGTLLHTIRKRARSAIFSPDSKKILIVTETANDNSITIWDAEKGTLLHTIKEKANDAVFSPDGKMILTTHMGDATKIFDAETGTLLHTMKQQNGYRAIFSSDGTRIAITAKNEVYILASIVPKNEQSHRVSEEGIFDVILHGPLGERVAELKNWRKHNPNVDLNKRSKQHGVTALQYAVMGGELAVVQWLLDNGADINAKDKDGNKALNWALRAWQEGKEGSESIVKYLLGHGAHTLVMYQGKEQ